MTNEEAIKILSGAIKQPNPKDGYMGQALTMAIKALEEVSRLSENLHREREQAYMNGYADGKSTCRWFSVDDKLPEENFSVLVWCPERRNIYCAYYRQGEWYVFGAYNNILKDVVAWLPLPEPYKEEKE